VADIVGYSGLAALLLTLLLPAARAGAAEYYAGRVLSSRHGPSRSRRRGLTATGAQARVKSALEGEACSQLNGGFSAHSGPSRATRVGTQSAQLMRQGRDWLCQPNALAGIYETSAIQGRLQAGLSVDYGLTGFLVAWLSGQHFLRAVPIAILIGGLIAAGDADRKCPIGGFVTTLTVANPFDPPPRHLPALRNGLMSAGGSVTVCTDTGSVIWRHLRRTRAQLPRSCNAKAAPLRSLRSFSP
jgi:hypothetical protein